MTDPRPNPFDGLREQINYAVDLAPSKAIEVIAKTLEENGIRVVLAAVHDDWPHPQVALTVTPDDVTAKVVSQVVDPVLRKVGVPESSVLMLSVAAGEAAIRAFKRYREGTARKIRVGETRGAAPGPVAEPEEPFKPAWDPNRRRKE